MSLLNRKEEYSRNLLPELANQEPAWKRKQEPQNRGQGILGTQPLEPKCKKRRKHKETQGQTTMKDMFKLQRLRQTECRTGLEIPELEPQGAPEEGLEHPQVEDQSMGDRKNTFLELIDLGETGTLGENWVPDQHRPRQPVIKDSTDHQDPEEMEMVVVEEPQDSRKKMFCDLVDLGDTEKWEHIVVKPRHRPRQPPLLVLEPEHGDSEGEQDEQE